MTASVGNDIFSLLLNLQQLSVIYYLLFVTCNLQQIVPPVLKSFSDQDSRVRYYACEALYNIAKVRMECISLFLVMQYIFRAH